MKLKNVSFLERHIEKFVLGLCVILALVIVWRYVVGQPHEVMLRTTVGMQPVKPGEVEQKIYEKAENLNNAINRSESPLPAMVVPNYTDNFQKRLRQKVVEVDRFEVAPGYPGVDPSVIKINPVTHQRVYALPEPPAPDRVTTRAGYAALVPPEDPTQLRAFRAVLGSQRPMDFRYVSVGGVFDMAAWRDRLRSVPLTERMPEDWWRDKQALTQVVLERQTLGAGGQWGNTTMINPLPGQWSLDAQAQTLTPEQAETLLTEIKREQDRIARPDFVPTGPGHFWLPPDARVTNLSASDQQKLLELNLEIARLREQLNSDEEGVSEEREPRRRRRPRENASPRQSAGSTGQPAMGATDAAGQAEAFPDDPAAHLRALVAQRDQLLGRDSLETADVSEQGDENTVATIEEVRVWGHDISARAGQTYRYRLRVGLVSPLFRQRSLSAEQRAEHFDQISIFSESSEWSQPVSVPPAKHFFLVNSNAQQRSATVEVWRIFNGAWRSHQFEVKAGDVIGDLIDMRVGSESMEVDMRLDAVVVDLGFEIPAVNDAGQSVRTSRLVYEDLDASQLKSRHAVSDSDSPVRLRLRNESMTRSAMVEAN